MGRKDLIKELKDIKLVYDELKKYEDLQIEPTFDEVKPDPTLYYGDEPKVVSKPKKPSISKAGLEEYCNIDYLNQAFETKTLPSGLKYKLPILGIDEIHNHSLDIMLNFCIDKGWTWSCYIHSMKNTYWTSDKVTCNIIKPGTKIDNFIVDDNEVFVCGGRSIFIKNHDSIYWPKVYSFIQKTSKEKNKFFEETLIKYDNEITEYEKNMQIYNKYLDDKKAYDDSVKKYEEALSSYNKQKKEYDKKLSNYKAIKKDLPNLIESKNNDLKKICDDKEYPYKYAKYIENIIELIEDYRADTIKEAINLYLSIKTQNEIISKLYDISSNIFDIYLQLD